MVLPIQRDRPALEAPGYSVIRRATRRLRARFASRAQTRSHYVIRLSDAATKFESAIGDIAYCSGEAGGLVTVRESDALWQRDSLIRRGIPIRRRVRAAARLTM